MNSFISSSEPSAKSAAGIGFILTFCLSLLLAIPVVWAFLIVIDPFDTGRLTPLKRTGMFYAGPRKANASRMRDPSFDAAIFGNSTSQLINPQRMNALTGQNFVQLTVPGTGPMEQRAMIEQLFRVRGDGIKTLILGFGALWCDPPRQTSTLHPFPFWLYTDNTVDYLRGLFRMDSIHSVPRRIQALRKKQRMADRDGFSDYELTSIYDETTIPVVPELPISKTGVHSARDSLAAVLVIIPPQTRVILLHPPAFTPANIHLSARGLETKRLCKSELADVAAKRPHTVVVDRWVEDVFTRNRSLFYDYNHYRTDFAKVIELDLSRHLNDMK